MSTIVGAAGSAITIETAKNRRFAIALVTPEVFGMLLSNRFQCVNMPPGATIGRIGWDAATDAFVCQLWHDSFEQVHEGSVAPVYTLAFIEQGP